VRTTPDIETAVSACVQAYERNLRAVVTYRLNPSFDATERNEVSASGWAWAEAKDRLYAAVQAAEYAKDEP
jgi:hypothetical protein